MPLYSVDHIAHEPSSHWYWLSRNLLQTQDHFMYASTYADRRRTLDIGHQMIHVGRLPCHACVFDTQGGLLPGIAADIQLSCQTNLRLVPQLVPLSSTKMSFICRVLG